jgi:hypothetical protein
MGTSIIAIFESLSEGIFVPRTDHLAASELGSDGTSRDTRL